MGSLDLPGKNSQDLHLVIATPAEEDLQQVANSDEWKGALSLDAYLRREKHLSNQNLTKDGGITCWLLVHQPDPNGPRQVLCGCETIKKRGLAAKDGKVEEVISHGVCSVFCPKEFRGRGYAGRMIADLGLKLQNWQSDNNRSTLFSLLWSDIGKDFYAARAWHPFPSAHVILGAAQHSLPEGVRLLSSSDLPELCKSDEDILRRRLASSKSSKTAVAIVPDVQHMQWHHAREDFVSNELFGKTPSVKGAIIGEEPGSRIWAYWTRVWASPEEDAPNTLHILRLVIEDDSVPSKAASVEEAAAVRDAKVTHAIATILRVAQSEAAKWDMKEVSIWNPAAATLAAAMQINPSAAVEHREKESITSLRWYGNGTWQDVELIGNEKYAWC